MSHRTYVELNIKLLFLLGDAGRCVDPIKPMLIAPGTQRLNLKHDKLLSSFAFKSNLRSYSEAHDPDDAVEAAAYTRPLLTST
jgi:hypothetical protein